MDQFLARHTFRCWSSCINVSTKQRSIMVSISPRMDARVDEINYSIENHRRNCDLLLVIAEQSLAGLIEKLNYMLD